MIATGGAWDRAADEHCYFVAGSVANIRQTEKQHSYFLIAVNELNGEDDVAKLESIVARGNRVFIDSGVFNLANAHAKAHGITMDEALQLAPTEIDGFDKLFDRYCRIASTLGPKCWGYIEVDQGGRENKIKTRARTESLGLRPIPVYHPFNDGWDYFDYLAERYDRICFGNVVQADMPTRQRLLATAWERRRKYPHLWIHLLGMTPNEWVNALPVNSCDSSTWLLMVRWSYSYRARCALKPFTRMDKNYRYVYGSEEWMPASMVKSVQFGAYDAQFMMRQWRSTLDDYERLVGGDRWMHQ